MSNGDMRTRRDGVRRQEPTSATREMGHAPAASASGQQTLARPHVRRAGASTAPGTAARPVAAPAAAGTPHAARAPSLARAALARLRLEPGWVLLPLRLFLGVTFLYAGLQKLMDPQFFSPTARGFIGNQIRAFAHGSPIGGLLLHVVLPHAVLFGGLIAYGEIAIGLGTLVGLLARPAAIFGGLLSLIFFLSASWRVYPYFYGADIVFVFAWIALGLQPHAGLPNLDARAADWLAQRWPPRTPARARVLGWLFSIPAATPGPQVSAPLAQPLPLDQRGRQRHAGRVLAARQQSRRTFLTGLGAGVAGTFGLVWLWNALHPAPDATLPPASGATSGGAATATSAPGQPTTGASGGVIARAADVPANSAATFTIPSNQDPGVVVHLTDGRFVAYDATCTHAGCPVQFDPSSSDLYCPCHGAVFDPAHGAAVLQGPTNTPLTPVNINVASNGDITLA